MIPDWMLWTYFIGGLSVFMWHIIDFMVYKQSTDQIYKILAVTVFWPVYFLIKFGRATLLMFSELIGD